jgi:hypothetical protein
VIDAHALLLAAHVAAGAASLVAGAVALWLPDRRPRAGIAYLGSVLAVAATALGLVALDPDAFLWLAPLAVLTAGLVVAGQLAPARDWGRRVRGHGLGGAYVALVTATLVVSLDGPAQVVAWLAPTLVGVALIERWVRRDESSAAGRSSLVNASER